MSGTKKVDLPSSKSNRSKKFPPPPPLSLPIPTTNTFDEDILPNCQKKSCLSSKECPHEHTSYILPISQRKEILQRFISSSSTKQRRSQTSSPSVSRETPVPDGEWLDLMRLITQKSFENDLTTLLDRYKKTYFDAVNSSHTSDATIRASLCQMVSEILTTYSTTNSSLPSTDNPQNILLSMQPTNENSTSKRKRSSTLVLNDRTEFVISHIIPRVCDQTDNHRNKRMHQHRIKQFQGKFAHLFQYIPNEDDQSYLINEGHLKKSSTFSSRLANNPICLMLYDEVFDLMDEFDLELSGIAIEKSFTLSETMLANIRSSNQ